MTVGSNTIILKAAVYMLLTAACAMAAAESSKAGSHGFAVYQVEFRNETAEGDRQYTMHEIEQMPQVELLRNAKLIEPPLLTDSDIAQFCAGRGRLVLNDEAVVRWKKRERLRAPHVPGVLVITVDGVSRLGVCLTAVYSSHIPRYPTLHAMFPFGNTMSISGGVGDSAESRKYVGECLALLEELFAGQGKLEDDCGPLGPGESD